MVLFGLKSGLRLMHLWTCFPLSSLPASVGQYQAPFRSRVDVSAGKEVWELIRELDSLLVCSGFVNELLLGADLVVVEGAAFLVPTSSDLEND